METRPVATFDKAVLLMPLVCVGGGGASLVSECLVASLRAECLSEFIFKRQVGSWEVFEVLSPFNPRNQPTKPNPGPSHD